MKKKILTAAMIGIVGISASATASDILAEVNGIKITKEEANAFLHQLQPGQPISYDLLDPKMKKKVLDGLIETELLAQAAKKAGADKSPEYRQMVDLAAKKLLINAWAKDQFDKTIVSESEAKAYYQKHLDQFKVPARAHARHILLKDKKSAEAVIAELKGLKGEALKQKFIELAKEKSTGPTGPKGGDLGYFTKEQMVLPFSKAAFALKKGTITETPVKTQFGWHVIYLEDKKPAQTIPFDQVKEKVIMKLKQQRFAQKMEQETKQLKEKAKVIYPDAPKGGK